MDINANEDPEVAKSAGGDFEVLYFFSCNLQALRKTTVRTGRYRQLWDEE
jgi:hypothetical protein